jgi:hypothetical protein
MQLIVVFLLLLESLITGEGIIFSAAKLKLNSAQGQALTVIFLCIEVYRQVCKRRHNMVILEIDLFIKGYAMFGYQKFLRKTVSSNTYRKNKMSSKG